MLTEGIKQATVGVELIDNYRQLIDEGVNTSRRRSVHIQHGESLARGDGQLERLCIEGRRSGRNTE